MSILSLLKQAKEIHSEIRKEFRTLSLEEKLKLALITKNAHILRETLLSSAFIPYGLSTEFLDKVIPYAERYEQFDLVYFATDIFNKYTELHPEFGILTQTELVDVIIKDKDFAENDPTMQTMTYMLKGAIGSFCYDW